MIHKHDLEILWDGFDGWIRVRCKDFDCDFEGEIFDPEMNDSRGDKK